MAGRLPDFVIIGAMKSGTSSLHEQLRARSGIFMSDPKEPNFFSDDHNYRQGIDRYRRLFEAARPEQLCGESSTHYTKLPAYPLTVQRMVQHLPEVRLIYLMRDPIERIVSQYIHEWSQREVRGTLEQAVRQHSRYLAYSCYARQLDPFLRHFGAARILPLAFERMVLRPDSVLAEVCGFLGDPSPEPAVWGPELGIQNPSAQRLRRSGLRALLRSLPGARPLVRRLPPPLRQSLDGLWQMRRRPQLPAELRAELVGSIDRDLARLGSWLGRSLDCDRWKEQVSERPLRWSSEIS